MNPSYSSVIPLADLRRAAYYSAYGAVVGWLLSSYGLHWGVGFGAGGAVLLAFCALAGSIEDDTPRHVFLNRVGRTLAFISIPFGVASGVCLAPVCGIIDGVVSAVTAAAILTAAEVAHAQYLDDQS